MRNVFALSLSLLLFACDNDYSSFSNKTSPPQLPKQSPSTLNEDQNDENVRIPLKIEFNFLRNTRVLAITWSGESESNWEKFSLCMNDNNRENKCAPLKEGIRKDEMTTIKLSEDISLEQLIAMIDAPPFLLLFDENEKYVDTYQIAIEQELINQTVQYIKTDKAMKNVSFGASVAISGDGKTIAVGAPFEDSASNDPSNDKTSTDSGAVYIFTDTNEGWKQTAFLKAQTVDQGDRFGTQVALSNDGETLAVSIPYEDSKSINVGGAQNNANEYNAGAVVVFEKSAILEDDTEETAQQEKWKQVAYLKASVAQQGLLLGLKALALSGDGSTIVVDGNNASRLEKLC